MTGPLSILLVEDHDDTVRVLSRLLRASGHKIVAASTIAAADDVISKLPIDLVLVDLQLPDGSGHDFMRHLRRTSTTSTLRGIAVTGYGSPDDIRESQLAGFDLHLTKPITFEILEAAIARVIGSPSAADAVCDHSVLRS